MLQAKGGRAGCMGCSNQRLKTGKETIAMTLMIRTKTCPAKAHWNDTINTFLVWRKVLLYWEVQDATNGFIGPNETWVSSELTFLKSETIGRYFMSSGNEERISAFMKDYQQVMNLSFKHSDNSERIRKDLSEIDLLGDSCHKHSQLRISFLRTVFRETKLLH